MITINDVRYGVTRTLDNQFPDIPIRGEEIRQNLDPPNFFVKLFPVSNTREFGRRYLRRHSFDIHYFPPDPTPGQQDDSNHQMHAMAEQLYNSMEYIEINGSLCRGEAMNHEIIDGVLHFFVDYNFHVMRVAPTGPVMQTLEQEGYVK